MKALLEAPRRLSANFGLSSAVDFCRPHTAKPSGYSSLLPPAVRTETEG